MVLFTSDPVKSGGFKWTFLTHLTQNDQNEYVMELELCDI
jgi:hypothetical protein